MKKQKIKKLLKLYKKIIITLVFLLWFGVWTIFGVLFTEYEITAQTATWTWSYNSKVIIEDESTGSWAYYVNQRNNSTIIWNSFSGYYYDSVYWYFKLDWSEDINDNVRIVDSTNKCSTWYWYKLDWFALWWWAWFIDFWHNSNTFVYYCLDDNKMYGTAYWKHIWYQDFEWISLEILVDVETLVEHVTEDTIFINDNSKIDDIILPTWKISNLPKTSNASNNQLWWDVFNIDDTKESIFYIIK